jgi:hypothetical protein
MHDRIRLAERRWFVPGRTVNEGAGPLGSLP